MLTSFSWMGKRYALTYRDEPLEGEGYEAVSSRDAAWMMRQLETADLRRLSGLLDLLAVHRMSDEEIAGRLAREVADPFGRFALFAHAPDAVAIADPSEYEPIQDLSALAGEEVASEPE